MTPRYYGVLSHRDRIKLLGQRLPFSHFLDHQPDGWLSSLAYLTRVREVIPPDVPVLWDCGAWSYKHEETPRLGKHVLTPEYALDKYLTVAHAGDMVVAPDHMLIDGVDHDLRRRFNRQSAEQWLHLVPHTHVGTLRLRPMAVVHGDTIQERITTALLYVSWGYQHLALGGLAARGSQATLVKQIVWEVRKAVPHVWLHVLGLSSPQFALAWREYGVQSFDGSSHFKQAFTGGAFYTLRLDGKMVKHQAARPSEIVTAPACECRACLTLREANIDTRQYGSNEHNMGRAAHNLNMLMRAHQVMYAQPRNGHLAESVGSDHHPLCSNQT